MIKNKLGCCGLNCERCPIFIATANNDDKLRKKTAKEWSNLYSEYLVGKKLKFEDMNCKGCWLESSIFIECSNCTIRKCCLGKGFEICANCDELQKCEILKGFFSFPGHESAKINLEKIRGN